MKSFRKHLLVLILIGITAGCASKHSPLQVVDYVDIERFMGDWYVIASIPTFIERDAHNAIESYRLNDDGSIATRFTFNADGFDGPVKVYNPTGFIGDDESNAIWGMQFLWPIKADYRIAYLDPDYSTTIIARQARDYVWLMARTPSIDEREYERLLALIQGMGYDTTNIRQVPQKWP